MDDNHKGRVQISKLAEHYGYQIEDCNDLIQKIREKIKEKAKWEHLIILINAPKNNDDIDGFSIPKEKLIYCKKGICPEHRNFVIAHELSHYLLGHKGIFFYRDTIKRRENPRRRENSMRR